MNTKELIAILFFICLLLIEPLLKRWKRKRRKDYYNNVYLNSDAWLRKRFVVLRRDNWTCVHCGKRATQVHHKRYARNIGREPIEWLEAICGECHKAQH